MWKNIPLPLCNGCQGLPGESQHSNYYNYVIRIQKGLITGLNLVSVLYVSSCENL